MVIDGKMHDFRDEDGKTFVFPSLKKALLETSFDKMFLYDKSCGINGFIPLLEKHIFGNQIQNLYMKSFITLGVKDGFVRFLFNHFRQGDTVIVPKPGWQGYEKVCKGLGINSIFVPFFDDKNFNSDGIIATIYNVLTKENSVGIVLNTPCHNPSGYSITKQEFRFFINEINRIVTVLKKNIYIFLDIVYLEYEDFELSRDIFSELCNLDDKAICVVQYSFSKSFLMYGMSLGLMTVIGNDVKNFNDFLACEEKYQNTLISNRSPYLEYVFKEIFLSLDLYKDLQNDVIYVRNVLEKRSNYVIEQVKKDKIQILPYSNGWKIFLLFTHSVFICNELKKYNIYFIPNKMGICISVASLTLNELKYVFYHLRNIVGRKE